MVSIKPNKTILEGRVRSVEPADDGWGSNAQLIVERSAAAAGYDDFLQAEPGSVVEVFAADADAVIPGRAYELTATVAGGPHGERVVLESAKPTD